MGLRKLLGLVREELGATEERAFAPHCDSAILHEPGQCVYCDMYPDWQHYRQVARIAFTGRVPRDDEVRCPAEQRRQIEAINRWPGNVPNPIR